MRKDIDETILAPLGDEEKEIRGWDYIFLKDLQRSVEKCKNKVPFEIKPNGKSKITYKEWVYKWLK